MTFKVGDVVYLKSGGPAVTIEHVRSDGALNVVWFVQSKLHRDTLDPAQVTTKAPAQPAAPDDSLFGRIFGPK